LLEILLPMMVSTAPSTTTSSSSTGACVFLFSNWYCYAEINFYSSVLPFIFIFCYQIPCFLFLNLSV